MTDRRAFIQSLSLGALATGACNQKGPRFDADPFSLGVASGDPTDTGVVLWTRLAPHSPAGGAPLAGEIRVGWEIASDESMRRIVRRGSARATAALAHSVHVEADGLEPERWYWYRFHAGDAVSPVGRTRTLAARSAPPGTLRFAFVSCQHYEHGYYTALNHLANEELDLVFHLGDYIYEDPAGQSAPYAVRRHVGREPTSLADYRARYALYKSDPALQRAHARHPWVVTWDDHEVDNNYAGGHSEQHDLLDAFLRRRAAAYQAYYEHQPVRRAAKPRGPDARLYRTIEAGSLARFHVLDGRQYRTDQPCGDRRKPPCPGTHDSAATMLGAEQERWLGRELADRDHRWAVLAQQVFMGKVDTEPGPDERYNMDSWNGYQAARQRLLDAIAARGRGDVIVLTGDVHSNWVADLRHRVDRAESPVVATELVGTSLTSGGDGVDAFPGSDAVLAENPDLRYHDAHRGYVRCTLDPERCEVDLRRVTYVSRPGAPLETSRSFVIERGRPGAQDG
ncbi:MAG: alkaline phosphatase D family protein [Gemmatimonadales bacterium]